MDEADKNQELNRTEAATLLGISRATLYRWESEGIGPPYRKFMTKVIYSPDELLAWKAAQTQRVEPEAANG